MSCTCLHPGCQYCTQQHPEAYRMNPVHDSLAELFSYFDNVYAGAREHEKARLALVKLQDALYANTPLAAHVEAFCSEVENESKRRGQLGKGGQHVPAHSMLVNVGPGALGELERYAREFRAALERKPLLEVATSARPHQWDAGTNRCTECAAYRHRAGKNHPQAPGKWLYSRDGEEWGLEAGPCSLR